jgi:2-polyprenyl-3-methyl-5-hydroxy-6-metoxy-1,4-benzoquinol methylase
MSVANGQPLRELFAKCLAGSAQVDPHNGVLSELAEYFHVSPDEARKACRGTNEVSVQKWSERDRSSSEGLLEFYRTQSNWIFGSMWYHANQATTAAQPQIVDVFDALGHLAPGRHLDYGCGVGSASLLAHCLGWNVALADVSTTFLDFARWRLSRHGVAAAFYDPTRDELSTDTFDLVTAFNTMVHIRDVPETLVKVHRAMKLGGHFVFNVDARKRTPATEWFLYDHHYPIVRHVRHLGFRREENIGTFYVYRKVRRSRPEAVGIGAVDSLRYNQYVSGVGDAVRSMRQWVYIARERVSGHQPRQRSGPGTA